MPLYKLEERGDAIIGIWKVEEEIEQLINEIHLFSGEAAILQRLTHEKRRQQWLSSRRLLREMLGEPTRVIYDQYGKPHIEGHAYEISITHKRKYVGAVLTKARRAGVDIEMVDNRIERIVPKFMRPDELCNLSKLHPLLHLYLHWGAKEALYKVHGRHPLNFTEQIRIEPFLPEEQDTFIGNIHANGFTSRHELSYFTFDNHVIVWGLE